MKHDHWSDRRYLALAALLLIFLTACGVRVDHTATLYDDQSWDAEIVMTLSREVVAMAGTTTEIEAEIADAVREMEQAGARVSYKAQENEGALVYVIDAKGSRLDVLQQIAFEDADIQMRSVDGEQQIAFSMYVPYDFAGGTITLIGDEIVSSNGRVIEKGKVQWTNSSGLIEAVIVPKSRFSVATLAVALAALAGVIALAAAGFYLSRRRPKEAPQEAIYRPEEVMPNPQEAISRFCGQCGMPLSSEARFCPTCGHPSKQ